MKNLVATKRSIVSSSKGERIKPCSRKISPPGRITRAWPRFIRYFGDREGIGQHLEIAVGEELGHREGRGAAIHDDGSAGLAEVAAARGDGPLQLAVPQLVGVEIRFGQGRRAVHRLGAAAHRA